MPSLPWTLVKPFVKVQCDIVDRFETGQETLLFLCMLCLADRDGRIKMDAATLATRIRWKLDALEDTLALLMHENPASKCKKFGGRCVVFLDPERPSRGFIIPAAAAHRKRNADTIKRREYKAQKQREYRAKRRGQRVDKRGQSVDTRGLPPPSEVDKRGQSVDTRGQNVDCDRDRDRDIRVKESSGLSLPPQAPLRDLQDPDLVSNVDEVLGLICEKVYAGKLRKNQVGQDTVRRVSEMLPFSREQIELVGDYYNLPPDECWPELQKRRSVGIDMLIRYWADHVSVAVMFDQKYFAR